MALDVIAGRYRVERAVGRGGMGTVWLCHDDVLHRDVAVKQIGVLPGESADDTRRAMREARTAAALNHRNAVSIYDVVDHDGAPWLVMEYVPSKTLAVLMTEEGALPPARVARIGAQVAAALASAHALGIMHRDVKPGNILVGADDLAKISDFGIARVAHDEQLTQTGMMTGTPAYFSPELARGAEPGPESDVWALGATLYAAVEGRPPYPRQTHPIAMLTAIATEAVEHPRRADFLLDPIGHMMDRDPSSRWTMADAESALNEAADPVPMTEPDPTPMLRREPAPEPVPAQARSIVSEPARAPVARPAQGNAGTSHRFRFLPLALGLALLVLLGGGYLLLTAGDSDDPSSNEADQPGQSATSGGSASEEPAPDEPSPQEPEPEDATPTAEATPTESATPRDADAARIGTVESYFETVTTDLDAGWSLLSPGMQQAVGRDSYDGFWSTIQDVQVADATPDGQDAVLAQITYTDNAGNVSVEQKRFTLVRQGDSYLIDDEVFAG